MAVQKTTRSTPKTKRATATTAASATKPVKAAKAAKPAAAKAPAARTRTRATAPATATPAATANGGAKRAPGHHEIALRAHALYVDSGFEHGRDQEHWFEAERQLSVELEPEQVA